MIVLVGYVFVRDLRGVREIVLPPRKVVKEGPHYKIYIPKTLVELYKLHSRRVEVIIRIVEEGGT